MFNIIVPVSQNHRFILKKSLRSIQKQMFEDFFVVVIGDGFLPEGINDSRFSFFSTEEKENFWGTSPRNDGLINIDKSRPYLCYLDADNEWLPNHLIECGKSMREYSSCCFGFYALDALGNVVSVNSTKKELSRIDSSGLCFNLKEVGIENIIWEKKYEHDFLLFDKISHENRFLVSDKITYIYNCNSGRTQVIDFCKLAYSNKDLNK